MEDQSGLDSLQNRWVGMFNKLVRKLSGAVQGRKSLSIEGVLKRGGYG
jgi:hypothetical protein